jgi:hypothetical protein
MDKDKIAANVDHMIAVSHKKKEALKAFIEAVRYLNDVYKIDRAEAFSVLAIMQSVVVGFTLDRNVDNAALNDIIAQAEQILSRDVEGESEGKNEL